MRRRTTRQQGPCDTRDGARKRDFILPADSVDKRFVQESFPRSARPVNEEESWSFILKCTDDLIEGFLLRLIDVFLPRRSLASIRLAVVLCLLDYFAI